MDRETLVQRNRAMAEAFHAVPLKHRLRRAALQVAAAIPIPPQRKANDRILLLRPDHLGDVLLTTPAIHALRAAFPDREIHALVGPWSANVLANFSDLDVMLTLPYPGFSRPPKSTGAHPISLSLNPRASAPHRLRNSRHLPPRSLVGGAAGASGRNPSTHRLQPA